MGIKADPVHVIVDEDRAKVFEPGSRRVLRSVRLESTESIGSVAEHVVNGRTLSHGRSAPARLTTELSCLLLPVYPEYQERDID